MRKLLQNSHSNAIRRNEREFLHSLSQKQPLAGGLVRQGRSFYSLTMRPGSIYATRGDSERYLRGWNEVVLQGLQQGLIAYRLGGLPKRLRANNDQVKLGAVRVARFFDAKLSFR